MLIKWLFGGTMLAKIALGAIAFLTAGVGFVALKLVYDRRRRAEGRRDVVDKLKDDDREREGRMKRAPKPDDDEEVRRMLEQGRG
jgi:hypothetical protein